MNARETLTLSLLSLLLVTVGSRAAAQKPGELFDKPSARATPLFADNVVAKGKGFEIKQSQVDEMYLAFKGHRAAMGETVPEEMRPRIEADIIQKLIATQLFLHRATDQDKNKAKEIAASFLEEQKKQAPSEESFRRQLLAVGMTPEEFTAQIREQAIVKAVIDREIKANKSVTDAEARQFYATNSNFFREPETVRASHILISTRDRITRKELAPELKLEKKRLAEKLVSRARAGEDFAKLVKEFSEDGPSKDRGGEYILTRAKDDPRRAMVPEFEAAAFSMKVNQVSDPVETGLGYHVIKVFERVPARPVQFSEVESRIKESLLRDAVERELPNYIEQMKKEAGVQMIAAGSN